MSTRHGGSYQYNVICDRCGWKFKNHQVRADWQGYMVCKTCYEPRHPLDFYTTKNDVHILPFTRPDKDTYITGNVVGADNTIEADLIDNNIMG